MGYRNIGMACCFAFLIFFLEAQAKELSQENNTELDKSAFMQVQDIVLPEIKIPTVVELPIEEMFYRKNFAVVDVNKDASLPYYYHESAQSKSSISAIHTKPEKSDAAMLIDGNVAQYIEFSKGNDNSNESVELQFESIKPLSSSSVSLTLQQFSQVPQSVSVSVLENGKERIVLAQTDMLSETVRFPETVASKWILRFTLLQPLRVSEVYFTDSFATKTSTQTLRFLAQPGTSYKLYAGADRSLINITSEAGNLKDNKDVVYLKSGRFIDNTLYTQADGDKDAIVDGRDNCVSVSNADQMDVNKNGIGDACDDYDKDGVINARDNCRDTPNIGQLDEDYDSIGDACDTEESRIMEKYSWLPWMAIGIVACVVIGLFVSILRREK